MHSFDDQCHPAVLEDRTASSRLADDCDVEFLAYDPCAGDEDDEGLPSPSSSNSTSEPAAQEWLEPPTPVPPVNLALDDEVGVASQPAPPDRRGRLTATVLSLVLHAWLLATLADMTLRERFELSEPPLVSRIQEVEPEDTPVTVVKYELANPDDRDLEVRKVLNAASVGQSRADRPQPQSPPDLLKELIPDQLRLKMYDVAEGLEIDERMVVKGTTGEAIVQLESALDRVTWEIALNLQEGKVLVAWLLDASGSLTKQRDAIAARLRRIYGELDALEEAGQIPRHDRPLLSGVVGFGQQTQFLTEHPTDRFEEIEEAFRRVAVDETGVENVFTAVNQVVDRWKSYRTQHGRRILLVTVTDEAGDDFGVALEPAIAKCVRYGVKAYVIGPSAVFGRREGFVPYVAPENGQTYRLPVDLGPETAVFEHVDLPFWYAGPQYTYLSSGYGPYALARLVNESGGVYFMTNMTTMAGLAPLGVFDSAALKPFEPDYRYASSEQYLDDLQQFPLRRAVVRAAMLSRERQAESTPALELRVNPGNFRQVASDAQRTVARSQYAVDSILAMFPENVEQLYLQEPSLRWRMNFCLTYGRLLALRVRCLEYNFACAELKGGLTPEDVGSRSNHWIFRPDVKVNYSSAGRREAAQATELLERVVTEAPGTPWAVLAQRELQHPLGIRVVERFVPPPPPRPPATAAAPAKKTVRLAPDPQPPQPTPKPAPKPPEPKLPRL